jgi:signal transduction histidine kinase
MTKQEVHTLSEDHTNRLVAMGQMAASLAHEIRNPLGSMELYCSVLKREVKDDHSKLELVTSIQQGISKLSHIVSNCLMFTKDVSVNKQIFTSAEIFLRETCNYNSASCSNLKIIEENEVKISDNRDQIYISWKDSGSERFMMDPYLLGQIVLNLMSNAIDACIENASRDQVKRIMVRIIHTSKENWKLVVEDTGKGMDDVVKRRIYDPFFTTKEKGTGLGLAIVHSLVSAHQGTIEVTSVPGNGTKVSIEFSNQESQE